MSKVNVMFKRDESKIKLCPAWVIYTMPLVFVMIVIGIIMAIVGFKGIAGWVGVVLVCLGVFWSVFSDKYFSMYENCRISFNGTKVIYQYELNSSVMPSSSVTTTITIFNISSLKVKRKTVVIKGSITKKAPLRGEVGLGKVELPIDFKERSEIIERLKGRV